MGRVLRGAARRRSSSWSLVVRWPSAACSDPDHGVGRCPSRPAPPGRRASRAASRSVRDVSGDRPHRRRHRPRPVLRPGLRPRLGADVADGGLAPHRRRPARRALRREPARHGPFIRTLGWRGAAAARPRRRSRPRRAPSSTPTPRASTPGSTATEGSSGSRSSWPASWRVGQRARTATARTVDPARHRHLAARSRPGTWAATSTPRSSAMLADAQLGDPARTDELFPAYRAGAPVIPPTGQPGRTASAAAPAQPDGAPASASRAGRHRRGADGGGLDAGSPRLGQTAFRAAGRPRRRRRTRGATARRRLEQLGRRPGEVRATGGALLANDPHLGISTCRRSGT